MTPADLPKGARVRLNAAGRAVYQRTSARRLGTISAKPPYAPATHRQVRWDGRRSEEHIDSRFLKLAE